MSQTLIAGLRATARDLHDAGRATTSAAGRFDALADAIEQEMIAGASGAAGSDPYKKPNGRFSEEGVRAVHAAFAAGRTVTEVAKQFGVHTSAISPRYQAWKAAKEKSA